MLTRSRNLPCWSVLNFWPRPHTAATSRPDGDSAMLLPPTTAQ
jgi:hypothetical protein